MLNIWWNVCMSAVETEYLTFTSMECLFSHKHTLKILYKSFAFSFISRWKMFWFTYKIFSVCLWGIRHSTKVKIKYSLLLLTRKHFVKYLSSSVKPVIYEHETIKTWRQNYVICSNEYLIFMTLEYLIRRIHTIKFCVNLNIFHGDINGNVSWCFFLNTVSSGRQNKLILL